MSHALEQLAEAMTVEEFARRTGRTVAEVVAYCLQPEAPVSRRSRKRAVFVPRFDHFAALRPVDVNDALGRRAFGERILAALEHIRVPITAEEISNFVGGTPEEVALVLAELLGHGQVRRRGLKRGALWTSRRRP